MENQLQGKEAAYMEGTRKLGSFARESKMSMNSYWLSPCRERRGVFLLGPAVFLGHESFSFSSQDSI